LLSLRIISYKSDKAHSGDMLRRLGRYEYRTTDTRGEFVPSGFKIF